MAIIPGYGRRRSGCILLRRKRAMVITFQWGACGKSTPASLGTSPAASSARQAG
jgi:TPP-dependent 2-oxoacid decarboxylase